jgi:hypothetical protein
MNPISFLAGIAFLGALSLTGSANAAALTYAYTVEHPFYGDIGTYTTTTAVDDADGVTRIDSQLRVAVKIMGIVFYREDADRSEVWRGTRLVSFDSVTQRNGQQIDVRGEVRDNSFIVTSPSGTTVAPADVAPSDPWALKRLGAGVVVSTKSGKVDNVEVTGGEVTWVSLHGTSTPTHHFHVRTATQPDKWEVWFDEQGVPVKFRSIESGTPIDFTIASPPQADGTVLHTNRDIVEPHRE